MTASYLTSVNCSLSSNSDHLLSFLLLSPCSHSLLSFAIDLLLLLSLLTFSLLTFLRRSSITTDSDDVTKPLISSLFPTTSSSTTSRRLFKLTLALTFFIALGSLVLAVLALTLVSYSTLRLLESLSLLLHSLAYLASAVALLRCAAPPIIVRVYFVLSFVPTALTSAASLLRLTSGDAIVPEDYLFLFNLALSIPLLSFSLAGVGSGALPPPEPSSPQPSSSVTGYATASFLSRATWHWMNPLLVKGYRSRRTTAQRNSILSSSRNGRRRRDRPTLSEQRSSAASGPTSSSTPPSP